MSIKRVNEYGQINVSSEAIATLIGGAISECYGIVGMASKNFLRDGLAELLKTENFSKGVVIRESNKSCDLDLYIVVLYGVRISEVVVEAQKKVAYIIKKALDLEFDNINIYVQGVKVIN